MNTIEEGRATYRRSLLQDCANCGKKAHAQLFETFSTYHGFLHSLGYFCTKCADHLEEMRQQTK